MRKNEQKCDCIFCVSKCPACESEAISVTFRAKYEYSNEIRNFINILHTDDSIEVTCENCEKTFYLDEWGGVRSLAPLKKAIQRELDLPANKKIEIDEENNFHIKQAVAVSEERRENHDKS